MSSDGKAKIYTIKDLDSVELINDSVRIGSQYLTAKVEKCNEEKSRVACASQSEIQDYFSRHKLMIVTATNYIDFSEVDSFEGPLRSQE